MPDPLFQLSPASQKPGFSLAELLTEAFTDYVAGPVHIDAKAADKFLTTGGVDLEASLLATTDDMPVGFSLVGRAHGHARLASMGIIPGWRCRGIGKAMLSRLIEDARQRGDRSLNLEVFERNLPAVALYEHAGFLNKGRLRGWKLAAAPMLGSGAPAPAEVSQADFLSLANTLDFPELPWQLSPHAASLIADEIRFFREGDTALAVLGLHSENVVFRCLAAPRASANPDELKSLLYSLIRAFPGKSWAAPAFWPEEHSPVFEENGFSPEPLTQLLMQLRLD